jgi:chromosome segregation ATPase
MESFAKTINNIKSLIYKMRDINSGDVLDIADEIYDIAEGVNTGSIVFDNLVRNSITQYTVVHNGVYDYSIVYKDGDDVPNTWYMYLRNGDTEEGVKELDRKIAMLEDVMNGASSRVSVQFEQPSTILHLIGTTQVDIEQAKHSISGLEGRMDNLEDHMDGVDLENLHIIEKMKNKQDDNANDITALQFQADSIEKVLKGIDGRMNILEGRIETKHTLYDSDLEDSSVVRDIRDSQYSMSDAIDDNSRLIEQLLDRIEALENKNGFDYKKSIYDAGKKVMSYIRRV